jgi:hypothetical protein
MADGADELDVVANISDIKAGRWDLLQAEINSIMKVSTHLNDTPPPTMSISIHVHVPQCSF